MAFRFDLQLPPPFKGLAGESIAQWFGRLEHTVQPVHDGADVDVTLVNCLPTLLSGDAYTVYSTQPEFVRNNYGLIKTELLRVFNNDEYIRRFKENLYARPRKIGENIEVYLACLRNDCVAAFPTYDARQVDDELLRRFMTGLDPTLRGRCYEFDCQTITEAVNTVKNVERAQAVYTQSNIHNPLLPIGVTAQVAQIQDQHLMKNMTSQAHRPNAIPESNHDGDQQLGLSNEISLEYFIEVLTHHLDIVLDQCISLHTLIN